MKPLNMSSLSKHPEPIEKKHERKDISSVIEINKKTANNLRLYSYIIQSMTNGVANEWASPSL